ncbi:hypothetical protein [Streptomyces sp. NPDC050600]|uniref:hypothetical protein n=1 Tax=Streptomyces sp. NPDC050600 TaxID=3157213 RepID=UPI0034141C3A
MFAVLPQVRNTPDPSDDNGEVTGHDRDESGRGTECVRVAVLLLVASSVLPDHEQGDGGDHEDTRDKDQQHDIQRLQGGPISAAASRGLTAGSGNTIEVQSHPRAPDQHVRPEAGRADREAGQVVALRHGAAGAANVSGISPGHIAAVWVVRRA